MAPSDQKKPEEDFERQAHGKRTNLAVEIVQMLKENKKWWLAPIILAILLLGLLVVIGGSPLAPFIYPIF